MSCSNDSIASAELAAVRESSERLAEQVEQVFAEAVSEYELRSPLTAEEREQADLIIQQAMDSVRKMMDRLATADG